MSLADAVHAGAGSKAKVLGKYVAGGVVAGMAVSSMERAQIILRYGRSSSTAMEEVHLTAIGRSPLRGRKLRGGRSPQLMEGHLTAPQAQDMIERIFSQSNDEGFANETTNMGKRQSNVNSTFL